VPVPADNDVLIRVHACGVCHTDLDEIEGRVVPAFLPIILGHQIVGRIAGLGADVDQYAINDRVGVAWISRACGNCHFCRTDRENLCPDFMATGRDQCGGYAEYTVAAADFVFPIPEELSDEDAAPLLCAGAIGFRSLSLAGIDNGQPLGLMGFGASAHLVLQLARCQYPNSDVFVFARSDVDRAFAIQLGARWAGSIEEQPPIRPDAIIDTTPAWLPVVSALRNLSPGGRLVINAIRKESTDQSALLRFDYPSDLWIEKEIKSVANVTRRDVREFLMAAARLRLRPEVHRYGLEDANRAIRDLKSGKGIGAKVLVCR
ncbi:MAG: alcohol dehydrogenase catalytic domain-containing protein, partial [Planctomycetaceae bacterium]